MDVLADYKQLLKNFLAFRSVSTLPEAKPEIAKTVNWLVELFRSRGMEADAIEGYGNPVVFAELHIDSALPTCLIYGHYDVQPAETIDGWAEDPFLLREVNGRLLGRGVVDNKGQTLIHMVTVFDLAKSGKLAFNVKFLLEGDEETGASNMSGLLQENLDALSADFVLISDGNIQIDGTPLLEAGFRGGFNCTLRLSTADGDLHSGMFGGAVPNSIHELSKILAKIHNPDFSIAVPGFYTGLTKIDYKFPALDLGAYISGAGVKSLNVAPGLDPREATGLQPTIQVTGVKSGYVGEGYRNSIPCTAECKINVRIAIGQESSLVQAKLAEFFELNLPDYVEYELTFDHSNKAIELSTANDYARRAQAKLLKVFAVEPELDYVGGSIPIVSDFVEILKTNVVSVPLANADCNMHAVDENFELALLAKGLEFSRSFLEAD